MNIDYRRLLLDEAELAPVREAIYGEHGPGYFIFRDFLDQASALHMVRHWTDPPDAASHKTYVGPYGFYDGCPNYVKTGARGNTSFFNFFWNRPADELTYSVAHQVQVLRNRIEERPSFREVFPLERRSVSFRVVVSRNGSNLVPAHRDWMGANFDPKRTQVTLFLSQKGRDYTGNGFLFETNQGRRISLGTDVPVAAGDLMIWRYNNEHAIDVVESSPDQPGFVRIVFPPEYIHERFPYAAGGLPIVREAVAAAYRSGGTLVPLRAKQWGNRMLARVGSVRSRRG